MNYSNINLEQIRELCLKQKNRVDKITYLLIIATNLLILSTLLSSLVIMGLLGATAVGLITSLVINLLKGARLNETKQIKEKERDEEHALEIKSIIDEDKKIEPKKYVLNPYQRCLLLQQLKNNPFITSSMLKSEYDEGKVLRLKIRRKK